MVAADAGNKAYSGFDIILHLEGSTAKMVGTTRCDVNTAMLPFRTVGIREVIIDGQRGTRAS
jgi:hypothetical protein